MNIWYMIAAFLIGVIFSTQPAVNGTAAKVLGSPVSAAALSIFITLVVCLAVMPFWGGLPRVADFAALPWWVVLGGLVGAFVVAGGAAIAPITGVVVFFVCLLAGQLVGSILVDSIGAFGMQERPLSLLKILGVGLAFAGVVLVRIG